MLKSLSASINTYITLNELQFFSKLDLCSEKFRTLRPAILSRVKVNYNCDSYSGFTVLRWKLDNAIEEKLTS